MNEVKVLRPPKCPPEEACAFCGVPDRVRKMVFVGIEGKKICYVCLESCNELIKKSEVI